MATAGELDVPAVHLLEASHQRKRHGFEFGGAGPEHQQRHRLGVGLGRFGIDRRLRDLRRADPDRLRDAVRVDDHDHRPVAQDGIAGEHRDAAQLGRHRLDHDFFGVEHGVHHDPERLAADLNDDDEALFRLASRGTGNCQQLVEARQRQQFVAQAEHRRVPDALDPVLGIVLGADQLDHAKLRNREAVAARLHDQRRYNGERQRDLDAEARTCSWCRFDVDGAADLIDVGSHDVHADAPTRQIRQLRGGGKPGPEDEPVDLRLGHLLDFGFRSQSAGNRLGLDALGIQPAAVVGDLDDDVSALVIGRESDRALVGLTGPPALDGILQTMVGGIAHHVRERILDEVEDLTVELGLRAVHLQLDLLAEIGGEVADDARQFLPGVADRLHAGFHHPFLQFGGHVGESLQRRLELGFLVPTHDFQELIAREHQFGNHGHEFFQRLHIDADGLAGDGLLVVVLLARAGTLRLLRFVFRPVPRLPSHSGGCGRVLRTGRFPECPFQIIERHFAWTRRTVQPLIDQRSARGP